MLKQAWTSSEGYNPLKMVKKHPKVHSKQVYTWLKYIVTIEKHDEIVYFNQVYTCFKCTFECFMAIFSGL